ncbi:hypothetical protein CXB51_019985 [Gossypium anomalum]|uniref:Zinc knuckle CX2CX4HX4C domain-containing protein n=1 Tax=Gossypium anomalum TaxID=47600 RepID=A0A8J6CWY7_9ROSI|nr:hypothetical protein CXB51_019985 [Gossypium anomalum]
MQNIMTNLLHPLGGVSITNLGKKRFLFRFLLGDLDGESLEWFFMDLRFVVRADDEVMAQQFGDFIDNRGGHVYMHVRVKLDVRNPLKRRKEIGLPQKEQVYIRFQYEKLSMFCFLCCRLGHNGRLSKVKRRQRWIWVEIFPSWRCRVELQRANRIGCAGGQQNGGLGAMGKKNNGVEADDNPVEIVDGKKRPGTTLHQTIGSMYTIKKHIYDEDHGY